MKKTNRRLLSLKYAVDHIAIAVAYIDLVLDRRRGARPRFLVGLKILDGLHGRGHLLGLSMQYEEGDAHDAPQQGRFQGCKEFLQRSRTELGRGKECLLELANFRRRECLILLDLFSKPPFRGTLAEMGIDTDGSERPHDVGIGDVEYAESVGAQLSHGIASELAGQNNAEKWVEMMVRFG